MIFSVRRKASKSPVKSRKKKDYFTSIAYIRSNNRGQNDCPARKKQKRGRKGRNETEKTGEKTKEREQKANLKKNCVLCAWQRMIVG